MKDASDRGDPEIAPRIDDHQVPWCAPGCHYYSADPANEDTCVLTQRSVEARPLCEPSVHRLVQLTSRLQHQVGDLRAIAREVLVYAKPPPDDREILKLSPSGYTVESVQRFTSVGKLKVTDRLEALATLLGNT